MSGRFEPGLTPADQHLAALGAALSRLRRDTDRITGWAGELVDVLVGGGRLLSTGNGGSASQAQHLTSELVGRFRDDRPAFSAIALCAETSALTAIGNDYGVEAIFERQVQAHGRPGDVLIAISTSGRSPNVVAAVDAANSLGMTTWALTGPAGNPLADACDDALCVQSPLTATIQEIHLVAIHLLCTAFDAQLQADAITAELAGEVS